MRHLALLCIVVKRFFCLLSLCVCERDSQRTWRGARVDGLRAQDIGEFSRFRNRRGYIIQMYKLMHGAERLAQQLPSVVMTRGYV